MLVDLTVVLTDAGVGAWWCFKHMTCSIGSANQRCIGGAAPGPGASALLAAAVLRGSGAAVVVLRRGLGCWCCAVTCIVAVLLCREGDAAVVVLQVWRCYSSGPATALTVLQ